MSDDWHADGFVNPPMSWREITAELTAERDDAVRAHAAAVGARQIWEGAAKRATAEVAALTAERDRLRDNAEVLAGELRHLAAEHGRCDARLEEEWRRAFNAEAERDTLAAQLACAGTVIEAAVAWRATWDCDAEPGSADPVDLMIAAVDAYQATPATTGATS